MEEKRIPSLLLNILFREVSALMGDKALAMLLRQSGLSQYLNNPPPADESPSIPIGAYSTIMADIYELFGPRGSRPIFMQGGSRGAVELRRLHPARFTLAGAALKLLPEHKRMALVLGKVAEEGEELYGNPHQLREEADAFVLEMPGCPYCAEILRRVRAQHLSANRPVCVVPAAILENMVQWATGNTHQVQETECIALGASACVFRIAK